MKSNQNPNLTTKGSYQIEIQPFYKGQNFDVFNGFITEHPIEKIVAKQIRNINNDHLKFLENQVNLLKSLKGNPYFVNFIEYLVFDSAHYLIFKFCNGGTLLDYIVNKKQHLPEVIICGFYQIILKSIFALHTNHIRQKEISIKNLFIYNKKILLSNSWFSIQLLNENQQNSISEIGNLETMAPKVIMLENSPIKTEIYCIGTTSFISHKASEQQSLVEKNNQTSFSQSFQLGSNLKLDTLKKQGFRLNYWLIYQQKVQETKIQNQFLKQKQLAEAKKENYLYFLKAGVALCNLCTVQVINNKEEQISLRHKQLNLSKQLDKIQTELFHFRELYSFIKIREEQDQNKMEYLLKQEEKIINFLGDLQQKDNIFSIYVSIGLLVLCLKAFVMIIEVTELIYNLSRTQMIEEPEFILLVESDYERLQIIFSSAIFDYEETQRAHDLTFQDYIKEWIKFSYQMCDFKTNPILTKFTDISQFFHDKVGRQKFSEEYPKKLKLILIDLLLDLLDKSKISSFYRKDTFFQDSVKYLTLSLLSDDNNRANLIVSEEDLSQSNFLEISKNYLQKFINDLDESETFQTSKNKSYLEGDYESYCERSKDPFIKSIFLEKFAKLK